MKKVYAFDFDGTLTTRDTLIEIILYAVGYRELLMGLFRYSPILLLMKLGLYDGGKAKERLFGHFFGGMSASGFNSLCRRFARDRRQLLRKDMMHILLEALNEGSSVAVVSASIDNWVRPFFPNGVDIIATRIEIAEERLTGHFLSANCYGKEKCRRLLILHPDRRDYRLIAYGDSKGDRELLAMADESHRV